MESIKNRMVQGIYALGSRYVRNSEVEGFINIGPGLATGEEGYSLRNNF